MRKEKDRPTKTNSEFATIGIVILLIVIAIAVGLSRTVRWFP